MFRRIKSFLFRRQSKQRKAEIDALETAYTLEWSHLECWEDQGCTCIEKDSD